MAGSVNKVILIGNSCKDNDIRSTKSGKEIANLTIATSERWKDKQTGERREKSEFHKVSVFNEGLVGLIKKYINKGDKLYIEGQLQTRKWQDKDGQDRYTTEIVLQGYNGSLTIVSSNQEKQSDYTSGEYAEVAKADALTNSDMEDSIPF